ncbi:unnamed protein product [Adineta steineri]|uniref:Peptidase S9 prolyl oligopeptidase catalytic domain-containing protein n=1 Tax=Adineta steineri TaxID=433720 RepID=A0A813UM72_9BILA|nr:unnamed protein product [Adineta steineri]
MILKHYFIILLFINIVSSKSKFTLDEFFNYTTFTSLTVAPDDGKSVLIQTLHPVWDRNINEEHLYLHTLSDNNKKLITTQASSFKPKWKGDLIALILTSNSTNRAKKVKTSDEVQYIHIYSISKGQLVPLMIGKESIHTFIWSTTSMSIYFATRTPWSEEDEVTYKNEWKDVIQYREQYRGDTIYRADLENMTLTRIVPLVNISYSVNELICSPDGKQLIYSTKPASSNLERIHDYELFLLDLTNPSLSNPLKLTNNSAIEENLKWSTDGLVFFTVTGKGSVDGEYEDSQGRLYHINITNYQIKRWANQFKGQVNDYILLEGGRQGVVILGQLSTETQLYKQQSFDSELIKQNGWNGTYENIVTASSGNNSSTIVFIHSSYEQPQEVYFINNIDQLNIALPVTSENKLFTERNLPKGKSYRWINKDDKMEIEGILLYPPDKFEEKNLPLFVLIHGGPYEADTNSFRLDWYYCAAMMATEGWLVLQPNYRGSTGYGDEFLRSIRYQIVSRPAKDILYGVDALIHDGIADYTKLTIGGYSYGAYLTNWIITQTTRFNAALSGAGASEHVADWGLTDIPLASIYMFGGFPWQVPHLYQQEAAIFQIDKVRTPTHIVVPGSDIRVAASENYILERALNSLDIPTKLIVLPDEPHLLGNNPWHEKIKLREEIRWLQKYGHICVSACNETFNSASNHTYIQIHTFTFFLLVLLAYFKH